MLKKTPLFFIAMSFIAVLIAAVVLWYAGITRFTPPAVIRPEKTAAMWRIDFRTSQEMLGPAPIGWTMRGKPGTKQSVFSIVSDPPGAVPVLRVRSGSSSGSIITKAEGVDLASSPILRWRWRALRLSEGADGRYPASDDQAIGIYIGSGSAAAKKTVSYRWDTETPVGASGKTSYGMGFVKVWWYTMRNKDDINNGEWYIEERDVAEDFQKAWGFSPREVYISVSSNSQYTGTGSAAELDWVEFRSAAGRASPGGTK